MSSRASSPQNLHSYVAYGLSICSALPLPELPSYDLSGAEVDLIIEPSREAPHLPNMERVGLLVGYRDNEVALRWSHFGLYRVIGGRRIEYVPAPGISDAAARVPLLGVCMGILLHQRNLLTLHASAISIEGEAVVFLGEKGAGKSTVTAALVERGHGLLSDDVTALSFDERDTPTVLAGIEAVKLWPDSLEAVGRDPAAVPALHEKVEKRVLRPSNVVDRRARPLRCIYVLKHGEQVGSTSLPTHDAFSELVRHTYAARFLGDAAASPAHFNQCASVLQNVPVRKLVRPDDLGRLDELVDFIEAEVGEESTF